MIQNHKLEDCLYFLRKKANEFILRLDLFGEPIELCFEKRHFHRTHWGSFCTIILILCATTVFVIQGLDIILHRNPVITSVEQAENLRLIPQRASLASMNIMIAFTLMDNSFKVLDENWRNKIIATGNLVKKTGLSGSVVILQQVEFVVCTKELTADLFGEEDIVYSNYICVKNTSQLNQYLTGELGSQEYVHIQINLAFNASISTSEKSALVQQIDYIGLFFSNIILNLQDYSNPITSYRKNLIWKIDASKQYELVLKSQHSVIETDSGYFTTDSQILPFINFKDQSILETPQDENVLVSFRTDIDPRLVIYKRVYLKVFDLLGTMGGLIKALMIIGFFLANPIAKLQLKIELVNRLFKFEKGNEDEENEEEEENQQSLKNYTENSLKNVDHARQTWMTNASGTREMATTKNLTNTIGSRNGQKEGTFAEEAFSSAFNDQLHTNGQMQPIGQIKSKEDQQKGSDEATMVDLYLKKYSFNKQQQSNMSPAESQNKIKCIFNNPNQSDHQLIQNNSGPSSLIQDPGSKDLPNSLEFEEKLAGSILQNNSDKNTKQSDFDRKLISHLSYFKNRPIIQEQQQPQPMQISKNSKMKLEDGMRTPSALNQIKRRTNQSLTMQNDGTPSSIMKHLRSNSGTKSGVEKIKLFRSVLKDYVNDQPKHAADLLKGMSLMKSKSKLSTDEALKKLFKSNEEKLQMKFWDYVNYFLGLRKAVKRKQIDFSMERINERFDIVFIMKKLIEVDKLKMIFLNDDQRKIFDYLPRPLVPLHPEDNYTPQHVILGNKNGEIDIGKEKQNIQQRPQEKLNKTWAKQMLFKEQTFLSKASEAMIAYRTIIKKGDQVDQLDQKLIDMLEDSKKLLFEPDSPGLINEKNNHKEEERVGQQDSYSKQINMTEDVFNLNFKKNNSINKNLSKNDSENMNQLSIIDSVNASLMNGNNKQQQNQIKGKEDFEQSRNIFLNETGIPSDNKWNQHIKSQKIDLNNIELEKQDDNNNQPKKKNNSTQNFKRHMSCIEDNHRTLQAYFNKNNGSKNANNYLLNYQSINANTMHPSSGEHHKEKIPTLTDLKSKIAEDDNFNQIKQDESLPEEGGATKQLIKESYFIPSQNVGLEKQPSKS